MVSDRDKRRLELDGMTEEEIREEFQRVFGEGTFPANPSKAVTTILDKEFGAKRRVYFSDKCENCGKQFPAAATPVERNDDGTLRHQVECTVCGKWTTTYGEDREDLARNFELPDNTDYSASC